MLNVDELTMLYNTLTLRQFDYCSIGWSGTCKTNLKTIILKQNQKLS